MRRIRKRDIAFAVVFYTALPLAVPLAIAYEHVIRRPAWRRLLRDF